MDKLDFKDYFLSLAESDRERFCGIAGVSHKYMRTHLVYRRKVPQPKTMDGIVLALQEFKAPIGRPELLQFFYPPTNGEKERRSGKPRRKDRRDTE